jgi:hypothetical protein
MRGSADPEQAFHQHESMSNQLVNVHDAFFKQVLSDPKLADTFLREHLPADVVGLLGPEPPEPVPGSFVDEELRQHHSDLLFRVRLKAGFRCVCIHAPGAQELAGSGSALAAIAICSPYPDHWYEQNQPEATAASGAAAAGEPRTGRLEVLVRICRPVRCRAGSR